MTDAPVPRLPVLLYHALSDGPDPEHYTIDAARFRRHLEAIAGAGRVGVSLARVLAGAPSDAGRSPVVLTFDDGDRSNRTRALPILEEMGFSATFFITTGRTGTGVPWLDWDEVAALAGAGMDVQAHGHTHRFLDALSGAEEREEMEAPIRLLDRHLGAAPRTLSLPGGRYTRRTLAAAGRAGYVAVCTSEPDFAAPQGGARLPCLGRFVVHQGLSDGALERIIAGDAAYAARAARAYRVKRLAKRVLGDALYHRLWTLRYKGREG